MSIDGPELGFKTEGYNTVHRKNAAQMVMITIDPYEHELWLRDTDATNPQAIFRRLHLKFRGSENVAVSSQIECQLLSMTMKSTRLTVTEYGTAIVENMRKLKEMGSPFCELKMVNLYLLGLNKLFDPIRFDIQKQIEKRKSKAPKNMVSAKKIVEEWAIRMRDRGLITFKDPSGGDPTSSVLTLVADVQSDSNTLESSTDTESTNVDYPDVTCAENNDAEEITAASSEYADVMHLQMDTPAPTTSATELSLRKYSEYNILHVMTTGGAITQATNPLKDPAAILMQAFSGISPDH